MEEDAVKEDPTQGRRPQFLGKAGWVKKAPGKLLANYKERFVHVEKTEIVVYENEDLQNCLERLDLENYDRCHEIKSTFKKKHRLILIRSPKSGYKVSDMKFQTQTAEDKESWIKALSDGINRAKNKVFDEVKVADESALDHVTRTRPKGNRNRRPPTRIHLKEVADVSSDGILRLDLDLENAILLNGIPSVDGTETKKEFPVAAQSELPLSAEEDTETEPQNVPPISEDEPDKNEAPPKKVLKPPVPPSKDPKSFLLAAEDIPKETKEDKVSEGSPDPGKKTCPPPTPPNKPTTQSSVSSIAAPAEARTSRKSPVLPSKDKKPPPPSLHPDQEVPDTEEIKKKDDTETTDCEAEKTKEKTRTEESHSASLPVLIIEKSEEPVQSENLDTVLQVDDLQLLTKGPSEVCSSNIPLDDALTTDLLLSRSPGQKQRKAEEKSVDSGQHSDDDSEGSGCEDLLAASSVALQGSQPGLDVLDPREDEVQTPPLTQTKVPPKTHFKTQCFHSPKPKVGLKPHTKVKSASISDLLSDTVVVAPPVRASQSDVNSADNVMKLKSEVAVEIEKTSELFNRASMVPGDNDPQDLLVQAMEKLKTADNFLRQVHKLKVTNAVCNRKSW